MRVITAKKALVVALFSLFAVSTTAQTKQSWLKRTWHNMNARFNGLYLAQEQLNTSLTSLRNNHVDNFDEVISVFPYGTAEQRAAEKPNLEEVYKKCSNVIKKHPKSKWIDDSRYLIGLAYLYQNDPIAAIETFQYVVRQFPDGEKRYDAKLGILMAYVAQEKYYDAEAIMSILKKEGKFPKRLERDFSAISAEIYIKQEKYLQAIEALEQALKLTRYKDDRSRYNFILAQLYLKTQEVDKSKEHFITTIKLNPPYELAFQSNLGLIKTISMSSDKSLKTPRKYLKKMLNDDKNIEYYDQIYYELASLEMQDGNIAEAIRNYKLSAQSSVKNKNQKANSYLALATLFFDRKNYSESQKYFDSTAMFVEATHPEYDLIKAKQLVLTDLIENLVTINTQDSLLNLAGLSREELEAKIDEIIAYEERQKELEEERNAQNGPIVDNDPFNQPQKAQNNSVVGGTWYFYNRSAIARGSNDFKRKWGSRPKTDLWRVASLQSQLNKIDDEEEDNPDDEDNENEDITYDPDQDKETNAILAAVDKDKRRYYKNIPFSKEAKAAALKKIENALFNAGKIYFESLKEYDQAKAYFAQLMERFPKGSNEAETFYLMYKIENELGNDDEADDYAKLLNERHENSPFNMVVNKRDEVKPISSTREVEQLYSKAYAAFQEGKYDKALEYRKESNEKYAGNGLQAKFDYLQALIVGKTKGKEEYVTYLQRIIELYPGTSVANMADYTIALLKEQEVEDIDDVVAGKYKLEPGEMHYFIVVYDGGDKDNILASFSEYNKTNHGLEKLRANSYLLGKKSVVAIQSFDNKDAAEKYYVEFIKSDKFFKDLGIRAYDIYTISRSNFRTLLSDADTDAYALFFVRNYIQ